ncbi:MAG: YceD family protein [Anaerorhabdus sp.]
MKWTKTELLNLENNQLEFEETINFDVNAFDNIPSLNRVLEANVSGVGYFLNDDQFKFEIELDGIMECNCSITNELVEVPFETNSHEIFSFVNTEDIEVHVVKNGIVELLPIIYQLIALEVPLRVVKEGAIEYPKGDGWRILSEDEYQKSKEMKIDKRLAKLKEYKPKKN